jgi:hypothetical protein
MTTQTATLPHNLTRRSSPGPIATYLEMLVDACREAMELRRAAHARWPHIES